MAQGALGEALAASWSRDRMAAQCAAVSTAPRPTTTFAETAKGRCGCVMPNNFVGVMKDRPVLIMGKQKAPTKQPMQSNAILSPVP